MDSKVQSNLMWGDGRRTEEEAMISKGYIRAEETLSRLTKLQRYVTQDESTEPPSERVSY